MSDLPAIQNRLREVRTRLGKSQQELAQAAGVARQTISGIEAGTYSVSLTVALRIARTLGCRVEELFWLDTPSPTVEATFATGSESAHWVQLARCNGRWIAHGLTFQPELAPADGRRTPEGRVELFDEEEVLSHTLFIAGCSPALALWARSAERWDPGLRVRWVPANSEQALALLARGEVHAAGVHFPDDNLPPVRAALGDTVALVELGVWQEGLLVAPGNPKAIQGIRDLTRPGIRLLNREPGAGCRALLDQALQQHQLAPEQVVGYDQLATSHLALAQAIQQDRADVGISVAAVATALGLTFLPLKAVRYELVLPQALLKTPMVERLLETLHHRWVRQQLRELGGYEISGLGRIR